MRALLLFLFFLLTIAGDTVAQHGHWCGMDEYREHLDSEYPGYSLRVEEAREQMLRQLAEDPSIGQYRGGVRTIPVVFHVVWNTTAQNISDAAILAQLDRLNADFATSYLSTQVSQFQAVATNTLIQFCLASTDPQGNPTTGITRTQTSVTNFGVSDDMKSNATGGRNPWPFHSYYNIWVCHIGFNPNTGGTAGFAYLPSWGAQFEAVDGTVLAYQVVGGDQTTLTHETGHYLGLHHTWGVNFESCSDDDGFADTPNCDGPNFGTWQNNYCPLTAQSCGSLDMVENFMDYASCPTMFSQQQSAYMNNILSTNYSSSWPNAQAGRASLVTSNGCEGQQASAPVADFIGNPTTVQVGANVNFTDLSTNAPTSWSWTFGDGGTSTQQNPVHSYASTGQYTVSLTATNATGSDTETKVNYITVVDNGGGGTATCDTLVYLDGLGIAYVNPVDADDFEAYLIDNDGETVDPTMADFGYTSEWANVQEDDGNIAWTATSWFVNTTVPADNWITFGPVTIPSEGADLSWRHAFAHMGFRDGYRVLLNFSGTSVSDFNGGTVLFNLPDNDPSTQNETDWASRSVNLPAGTYAGQQVYIGFHHNALDQVAIFLDDIMMYGCNMPPVGVEEMNDAQLTVYPNPSSDNFTVRMESAGRSPVRMTLYDALGRQVWTRGVQTGGTVTTVIDAHGLPAGVYSLTVVGEEFNLSRKLVLTR